MTFARDYGYVCVYLFYFVFIVIFYVFMFATGF